MRSPFFAKPIRSLWRLPARQICKKMIQCILGLIYMLIRPLIPYESMPGQPCKPFAEISGTCTRDQLALCQYIFDESTTRRIHIEQKAQWTFTAIAFLIPTLASVLIFFLRDANFQSAAYPVRLTFILSSSCLLVLSFISALRAMTIKYSESLFLHSVIEEDSETFRKYEIEFHAKGLLYCAVMNAAINDHMAQFVKGAYTLLAIAVICFAMGVGTIALNLGGGRDSGLGVVNTETASGACSENCDPRPENPISHTKDQLGSKGEPNTEPERFSGEVEGVGAGN